MPRFPRCYLNTSCFHVMVQGINKSYIFEKEEEKKIYIKELYKSKNKFDIEIIAYCIMDNHAHLLLRSESLYNLSTFMHNVNTIYAIFYNKMHKRVGYVFRDRYKSEGIYSEKYFYNCIRYIYDNPVKANICKKPEEYKFSYIGKEYSSSIPKFCEIDFIEINDNECDSNDIISRFFTDKSINLNQLKMDNELIRKVSKILKNDYKVSLRKIAEFIGISREKVRNLYRS